MIQICFGERFMCFSSAKFVFHNLFRIVKTFVQHLERRITVVFTSTAYFWLQHVTISYSATTRFKLEIGAISILPNLFEDWQDCCGTAKTKLSCSFSHTLPFPRLSLLLNLTHSTIDQNIFRSTRTSWNTFIRLVARPPKI